MGVANGGQVLVSDLTAGLVEHMADVKLVDLGSVELKGVVEPVRVYGVAGDGHDWLDVPLLTGQVTRGNLPRLQTESVGDLASLQRRVADLAEVSVVTLTGSGGVGKTRAAIEIGWLVVDEFVDGVWLVELAPVADPDLVVTTIGSALGASLQPGSTMIESIVDWCLSRRMLLIIDNCEHVLDSVIEVVHAVVASCPTVTIIATSREPLGVAGETVTRIASLDERYATELFILRARSADAGFEPSDADGEAIARICRRLDGIPLAIELAAARIRSLGPAELLERLDDRFRLLRSGGRGGLERHQTLRATVAWSYQLLAADAQLLFDRLSVFAGSFDLGAAEAVCAGDDLDSYDIVDLLGDLVDKSMVVASRSDRGTRYRLLETLRQYGEERLDDRVETMLLRDVHLRHFVEVAQRLNQRWQSPDQAVAGARFDDDWENIGAAHAWAITTGDIDHAHHLIEATLDFGFMRVRRDHQEWVIRTMALAETTARHNAFTIISESWWATYGGDPDRGVALAELATAAATTPSTAAAARATMLFGHMVAGRSEEAIEIATELRSTLPAVVDPIYRCWATVAILQTQTPTTIAADADAALAAARAVGAPSFMADALRTAAARWYVAEPPDFDRLFIEIDEVMRLEESVGISTTWSWVISAWARTIAGDDLALETLAHTVRQAFDERLWAGLDAALEVAPLLLARQDPMVAATIYGHLEGSSPPFGRSGLDIRGLSTEVIEALRDADVHRSRGATMNRHEIVALTLPALDNN